ncbi:MAG: SRPBCC domain-containing protein [Alphaproteobacteria bacterium]|nr:SRPBCC domain-containing protein [Alphaproteobacteria bacterium]
MSGKPGHFIRIERRFDVSPERLFDAWVDPGIARRWLFTSPDSETNATDLDPKVGGVWRVTDRRGGVDYAAHGEYLAIDRPHRLVFTMTMPQFSSDIDRITIEIRPDGDGAVLTLLHESAPIDTLTKPEDWGPKGQDQMKDGWGKMFDGLARLLA